jgi:L-fucose isomerase-like protein
VKNGTTFGVIVGNRGFSTDDSTGRMRGYVGERRFSDDPLETFGGAGVVETPRMHRLLHYICENSFEHHVAANSSTVAAALYEATTRYLGWDMYYHQPNGGC